MGNSFSKKGFYSIEQVIAEEGSTAYATRARLSSDDVITNEASMSSASMSNTVKGRSKSKQSEHKELHRHSFKHIENDSFVLKSDIVAAQEQIGELSQAANKYSTREQFDNYHSVKAQRFNDVDNNRNGYKDFSHTSAEYRVIVKDRSKQNVSTVTNDDQMTEDGFTSETNQSNSKNDNNLEDNFAYDEDEDSSISLNSDIIEANQESDCD